MTRYFVKFKGHFSSLDYSRAKITAAVRQWPLKLDLNIANGLLSQLLW